MRVYRPMDWGTPGENLASRCYRVGEPTELFLGKVASPQSPPPLHSARSVYCIEVFRSRYRGWWRSLPALLTIASSFVQLAIPIGEDLSGTAFQLVQGRDVPDPTVQPNRVVAVNPETHDPLRVLQRQRHSRSDALGFEGLMPAFDLAIRLRIVRRRLHVRHAADPDELFEVFRQKLRAVV